MIEGKSVLAIIPARGGSRRVPGKNIRIIAGKPLIGWTILEAKKSKFIDRLILSSEDKEIHRTAREYGCEVPFERPPELAADDTPGTAPVLHAIDFYQQKYDYVVLLQPTSPLRLAEDIDNALLHCLSQKAPACFSVFEMNKPPSWMFRINEKGKALPYFGNLVLNSSGSEERGYLQNGAIYISECQFFIKNNSFETVDSTGFVMPTERSLDIDTELDFELGEFFLQKRENKHF
ncbi:MAG: acylneuraminate cytidylyltransferase family protein [Candidatus Riflebacteria bacterium]|nr:acylneuraminate cytidylyltransferase family protein [Candidatus Riflebacteria bacterium]